jgi:hypothetical protein
VINALNWNQDGRALLVGDRIHAVTELLEGRWLTFHVSIDARETVDPGVDLACLARLVEREGLPLAGGGTVTAERYGSRTWTGPTGWLPVGETLGIRLVRGMADVSAVVIDDAAEKRGARLVELLTDGHPKRNYDYYERREMTGGQRLLGLIAEHDGLLRDPTPPLSSLFPAPPEELRRNCWQAPPPYWQTVQVQVPPDIYARLNQLADMTGDRLNEWLVGQLLWLADAPLLAAVDRAVERALDVYDDYDRSWDGRRSVLPFPRQRGDDLGAS